MWTYRARLERVIDGDTAILLIDAGFNNYRTERIRFLNCDAPELPTPAGLAVRNQVIAWFRDVTLAAKDPHWPLQVTTTKTDSFGRYLGVITPNPPDMDGSINIRVLAWTASCTAKSAETASTSETPKP